MYEDLSLGSMGEDVIILQEKLKRLGFYNPVINGNFSLATEEGVKAFQRSVGLVDTGVVDSNTWDALNDETEVKISTISIFPDLGYGSTGSYVRDLQTKLKALLFYTGDINGDFDRETELAVKRFQINNEITANGIVDSNTWRLINMLYGNLNSCVLEDGGVVDDGVVDSLEYVVKSGDTLYSIARRYNTTVNDIKSLNNLTSDTLKIGQVLRIPTTAVDNYFVYTVQPGDSLSVLAERFNTTTVEIKSLNNLKNDLIIIGQTLKIPTKVEDEEYINYVVLSGDTLYSIARLYNTSVDTIKSLNNLTSNILQIGQVLKIPTTSGVNYVNYTVLSGDTLYSIARRYNTSVDNIKSFNNLSSNILQVGQTLKIPL